ncbi:MAG: hypothetical protein QM744_11230 [Mesorhizobium sp.]
MDRAALQHHRNRVSGLQRIVLTSPEPRTHSAFLEAFFDVPASSTSNIDGLVFKLPNVVIEVVTPEVLHEIAGLDKQNHDSAEGLHPVAAVFAAPDIEALGSLFKADGITYLAHDNVLVVPPATGQGAHFIFEASA